LTRSIEAINDNQKGIGLTVRRDLFVELSRCVGRVCSLIGYSSAAWERAALQEDDDHAQDLLGAQKHDV